jgi:light-regulated signal transduction histidine kinase (bacteriophytochrome)
MEAYHRSDVEVWLDSSATPRDGDGLVISFIDITERKKAQRQADTLIGELRKSNANLEQFAYVASHDLQEPLRKVMAFGDILQKQYASALDEAGIDMIRRMQSAAQRMQVLIRDLLTFSRVANSSDEFCPVDLNTVVIDVLADLDTLVIDKGARAETDVLPVIKGDALQLRQLFQNLLSNALKFVRSETVPQIRISYTRVDARNPTLLSIVPADQQASAYHRIEVSDNGIGFEPQYATQIFQLFQRLHSRSQYTGTGIGLSIVQKVVENHRGYIQAQGRPGEGSTFVILLPTDNV